jgi:putative DNA primase/helicase
MVRHLGDRLVVDGQLVAFGRLESRWTYGRGVRLAVDLEASPAEVAEARRLIDLCEAISFTTPERDGPLLAGWLMVMLICGLMPWRPHVWITSEAGEGKTWVIEEVAKKLLGDLGILLGANSTEAAVRRVTGADALALLYDEAEAEALDDQKRLRAILALLRHASSDSTAPIMMAKANTQRDVVLYRPRFGALLGSIQVSLVQSADLSRFLVMPMRQSTGAEFVNLKEQHAAAFTEGFPSRLLIRALRLAPVILHNFRALSLAIAKHSDQRAGDTLGACLAGYLALIGETRLDAAAAMAEVSRRPWLINAAKEQMPVKDWRKVLVHLAQLKLRVDRADGHGQIELSLAEAVAMLRDRLGVGVSLADLGGAMGRLGIRVAHRRPGMPDDETPEAVVLLANGSKDLKQAMLGTSWVSGWRDMLASRAPRACETQNVRFAGLSQRCLSIPVSVFLNDEEKQDGDDSPDR